MVDRTPGLVVQHLLSRNAANTSCDVDDLYGKVGFNSRRRLRALG